MKKTFAAVTLIVLASMLGGCCWWPYCGPGGPGGGPGGPGGPGGGRGGPGGGGGPQGAIVLPHSSALS
ncbi:hypothetical protein [Burkholderia sp. BCC1977]|uniref:hypothetical protein n=1 Tax=Burkholderia sp. BCC1977 TaxID=2817440 RepID=UPI002ABD59AF|nr:hypothetical protein [Burkholderia sp. BCC1977]